MNSDMINNLQLQTAQLQEPAKNKTTNSIEVITQPVFSECQTKRLDSVPVGVDNNINRHVTFPNE